MLEKAGIISEIDGLAIEMFVDSIAVYREANQAVLKDGFTVMGGRGATKANPAISARDTAWTQLHRLLREFGLTPKSRGQKPNTDLVDDDNDMLRLLSPGA